MSDVCRAGHAWVPENTYTYPDGRRYCRACHAAHSRLYRERDRPPGAARQGWLRRSILATLTQHPEGLGARALRVRLGYRSSVESIQVTVWNLRHKRGVPVAAVRTGNRWRYVLQEEVVA